MPIKEEDVIKIDIKFHHTTCNHLKSKHEHGYFLMSLPVALHLILDTDIMSLRQLQRFCMGNNSFISFILSLESPSY